MFHFAVFRHLYFPDSDCSCFTSVMVCIKKSLIQDKIENNFTITFDLSDYVPFTNIDNIDQEYDINK